MCNCHNNPCICSISPEINCDPCLADDTCEQKMDSACVSYNLNKTDSPSNISCFLGLPSNTPLKTILEVLDEKLCELNAVAGLNFIENDCISWTKTISPSGVITIVPIVDYECLINNIAANALFCQKVQDCAVNPPSCSPVSFIQVISSTTNTLTFGWTTVTGAQSYDIKLFSDFTFTTQVGATQTINHPTSTATFTGLSANTQYYVQIRVSCTNGLFSSLTSAGPFTTGQTPDVSCPAVTIDSVVVDENSVTVDWTGGIGATQYNVYINGVLQSGMPTVLNTLTINSLPNGIYNVKVEALPCSGVPQYDIENFEINFNAPTITLSCETLSQISGSFQQGLSSSGTIRVPVTVTGSDIVNVTAAGTGFTGSVTGLVVNTFTTFIDIPVSYNGSAPTGTRSITITVVGATIASTNCIGNVTVTCPPCIINNGDFSIINITSSSFTVSSSGLAIGDSYNVVVKQGITTVYTNSNITNPTQNVTGLTAGTSYTVEIVKNCVCGNASSVHTLNAITNSISSGFSPSIVETPNALAPSCYTDIYISFDVNNSLFTYEIILNSLEGIDQQTYDSIYPGGSIPVIPSTVTKSGDGPAGFTRLNATVGHGGVGGQSGFDITIKELYNGIYTGNDYNNFYFGVNNNDTPC